ncbi:Aromatic-L-Amino-Acid Decarboxylase [Manis pentadactyla]|nr:Aromatic-L-Amino-Acid Decarboxylase [Manis pentadactyla]
MRRGWSSGFGLELCIEVISKWIVLKIKYPAKIPEGLTLVILSAKRGPESSSSCDQTQEPHPTSSREVAESLSTSVTTSAGGASTDFILIP